MGADPIAHARGTSSVRSAGAFALGVVVVFIGTAAGCTTSQETTPASIPIPLRTFVGQIEDTDAYVAVITDGERLSGYVTSGDSTSIWLGQSQLTAGSAELVSREGEGLGAVEIQGDSAHGEITVDSRMEDFVAKRAKNGAGLHSSAGQDGADSFQAGWIVLRNGTVRGTLDINSSGTLRTQTAPSLAPTVEVPGFGERPTYELTSAYLDSLEAAEDQP